MGLVNRMDQNMAKYRVGIQMKKKGGGPGLFEWGMLLFKVCGYCIVLAKMTTIILCLFWISEEMLSMQFFWKIIMFTAGSLKDTQNFFIQSLPLYT